MYSGKNKIFLKSFILALFLLANSNCAYRFGQQQRAVAGGFDTVSVPIFANKTSETGVEVYFTNSLIEEIERSHVAKITPKTNSQVIIEGSIEKITYLPETPAGDFKRLPKYSFLSPGYRMLLQAKIKIVRQSDKKILWTGQFDGERRYQAPQVTEAGINSVNPLYNHSARHYNIKLMAKDLMAEAYDRFTENF